jgi:hypothetical protein
MIQWLLRGRMVQLGGLTLAAVVLSGCSLLFGGGNPEPTPTIENRVLVPTFTPTAIIVEQVVPTPEPQAQVQASTPEPIATATPQPEVAAPEPPAEPTPTPAAKIVVTIGAANVRNGPGTNYGLVGSVTQGQSFEILARSADSTWWQFCCVNGQQAWIFGALVTLENVEGVPVAQDIPAPPPVAAAPAEPAQPAAPAPAPQQPAPQQPAPEPEQPAPAPGGAVHAGPCGGDDGCKFKLVGGPTKARNGGFEFKLQLFFVHSGVDGGQPQGDYRLGIEKDGQLLSTFGDTRSIALTSNSGPMGNYNYEAKIGSGDLPGASVAGTYFFWVLDGNRERDSEVFRLDLAGDEGEVWIKFDQG